MINNNFFEYPDEPEKSRWTKLDFGKCDGKTLPQVMFSNPNWFFWAYENKIFKGKHESEAKIIHARSTNIKIPQEESEELVADYIIHRGKFCGVNIVPKSNAESKKVFRRSVLDMSIPRRICEYDKAGSKLMVEAIKVYVLGDPKAKMTKGKCEEFFNDPSHFVETS